MIMKDTLRRIRYTYRIGGMVNLMKIFNEFKVKTVIMNSDISIKKMLDLSKC